MNVRVVDYDLESARVCSELLRYRGHQVWTSANAGEALELVRVHKFDSALLDLVLPDMDGFSLAAEIHSKQPAVRFLIVSGHFDPEDLSGAISSVQAYFRTKPLDFAEVESLLESHPPAMP